MNLPQRSTSAAMSSAMGLTRSRRSMALPSMQQQSQSQQPQRQRRGIVSTASSSSACHCCPSSSSSSSLSSSPSSSASCLSSRRSHSCRRIHTAIPPLSTTTTATRSAVTAAAPGASQLQQRHLHNSQVRRYSSAGHQNTNFFAEFAKSFKRQVEENKEFQSNIKVLAEKGVEINESDAMKRAREAMTKTSGVVGAVAQGVGKGVEIFVESAPVKAIGGAAVKVTETVQKVAEPIMETQAAKTIASGINSVQKDLANPAFSAQYAEYLPKELRDAQRAERLTRAAADPSQRVVLPNPDAGTAVTTTNVSTSQSTASRMAELWEKTPIAQGISTISRKIEESENPTIEWVREMWYKTSSVMDETEEARVVKAFKEAEPRFNRHTFLSEVTSWIVPEVLEAHLKGDMSTIRQWCSEKVTAELGASVELQRQNNLVSDCKLLDLRRVDIRKLIFLDDRIPVAVVSFGTQEILLFRDRKTGDVVLGTEDHFDQAYYSIALTKSMFVEPDKPVDPQTNGWTVISWSRQAA